MLVFSNWGGVNLLVSKLITLKYNTMAFLGFGKKSEGGLMDAIRCDEKDFLIWKWRPAGQAANTTNKENAIRTGSSISVRPGQAAVFLYQQKGGDYDVIMGPYNDIIKTENMPILSSIIGAAYAGGTPFQAEVYYFSLAKGRKIPFTIPFFTVSPAEPEFQRGYDQRVAISGSLVFEVPADKEYIKNLFLVSGGNDTTFEEFESNLKDLILQDVKQIVSKAPKDTGIHVMHFNELIGEMGQYILARMQNKIFHDYGVLATDVRISDIRFDEECEGYQKLKRISEQSHMINLEHEKNALLSFQIQRETMRTDADIRNMSANRMAEMQLNHQEDLMARMREESQFAQHQQTLAAAEQAHMMNQAGIHRANLASETAFLGAHQVNVQADVMKTGLNNMGDMGALNLGGGSGHMNPAGMMTSMVMGQAVATQMGGMMNNMGSALNQSMQPQAQMGQMSQMGHTPPPMPGAQTPPPMPGAAPSVQYFLNVNNQQCGPFDMNSLMQMAQTGQINPQTMAWCNGMPGWAPIGQITALAALFQAPQGGVCPPVGGMCPPPMPNM